MNVVLIGGGAVLGLVALAALVLVVRTRRAWGDWWWRMELEARPELRHVDPEATVRIPRQRGPFRR